MVGASVAEWLMRLALKLLAPLRSGLHPIRGRCQLLTEGCWFTSSNNLFLQLWKLTAIYLANNVEKCRKTPKDTNQKNQQQFQSETP